MCNSNSTTSALSQVLLRNRIRAAIASAPPTAITRDTASTACAAPSPPAATAPVTLTARGGSVWTAPAVTLRPAATATRIPTVQWAATAWTALVRYSYTRSRNLTLRIKIQIVLSF